ncbi:MAG: ESX secretion-associated protein EspG [Mycobacterium sp.]
MITDELAPVRYDVEPWFMTGFEFRCAWEALGLDHMPFPLSYRNRQQYMSEVEADRDAALSRLRESLNPNRVRILEALRFPAFMMRGFGRIEEDESQRLFRLFGVIGTTGYCAVVTQDPSEQTIFGEDVQIIGCANIDFPQVVLEAFPEYAAGTRPSKKARYENETLSQLFDETTITASILLAGSADFSLDYELRNPSYLTLVNLADDGAYLVNEGAEEFQVVPATVSNLLDAFRRVEELQMKAAERLSARSD